MSWTWQCTTCGGYDKHYENCPDKVGPAPAYPEEPRFEAHLAPPEGKPDLVSVEHTCGHDCKAWPGTCCCQTSCLCGRKS
jgi:hypothetical protein